jgi:predicted transcriptional regulator YdeE
MAEYKLFQYAETPVVGMTVTADGNQTNNSRLISQLWKKFNSNIWKISNRVQRKDWVKFGISFDNIPAKQFTYLAGVAVADLNSIPEGMIGKIIPLHDYAVFCHQGSHLQLKETMYNIYKVWQEKYNLIIADPEVLGLNHFERYDRRFNWSDPDSKIDIYIPVVNDSSGLIS